MFFETDSRIESKYNIPEIYLNSFLFIISKYGFFKSFPTRFVYSLYFDDDALSGIKDNLAGITPRKKYRLRWYSNDKNKFFGTQFEIKIKKGTTGTKKVFKLDNSFDFEINDFSIHNINKIISNSKNEILLPNYLSPRLICRYSRDYFKMANGDRLTIDKDIVFKKYKNSINIFNESWINLNSNILELKFCPDNYVGLLELIKKMPAQATKSSKYLIGSSILEGVSYL